ncbi:hypothetical protein FHT78_004746 [Rhizobium sp. BK196]|uniref:hypothetical protein n=1 Tax=Rhizobium sp. BK196 TaxID=2587073 RepID=UPI001615C8D9|nr:hypothetical protein [Rhizobium sp. BK196]MBB3312958.1 hypothetical protein [Rhizobium sp. BK196]
MQRLIRLWAAALLLGCGAFAGSAYASLETDMNYSALPKDEVALNEYTSATICKPVEPHYLPSFIRAADGTIIGVGYIQVREENTSNC